MSLVRKFGHMLLKVANIDCFTLHCVFKYSILEPTLSVGTFILSALKQDGIIFIVRHPNE